jgi:hypothetical protein
MSCANQYAAAAEARAVIAKRLSGSRAFVAAYRARAGVIAATIWKRFHVEPRKMRVKHLRWYLEVATRDFSPSHGYRLWTTVRVLVIALGHGEDWIGRLQGPWIRADGDASPVRAGRPAKLPLPFAERDVVAQGVPQDAPFAQRSKIDKHKPQSLSRKSPD